MNHTVVSVLALTLSAIAMPTIANAAINRIVELQGEAKIKRKDSPEHRSAFQGYILKPGDVLQPESGAALVVSCADRELRQVQAGVPSGLETICPSTRSLDAKPDDIFLDLLNDEFEYETLLLEQPLLQWPSISGATRYRAALVAADEVTWEQEVSDRSVRYAGPALQPGVEYRFVVEAVDGNAVANYELRLKQLEPALKERVYEEVAQIEAEDVSQEAKALMLTDYYRERQPAMLLAAAAPLEALVEQRTQTAVVHRLLGDIYVRLGRWQEASTRYQQALTLAELVGNEEEKAAAQEGLAHVFVAREKLAESKDWLTQAREGYKLVGNVEREEVVSQWLTKLNIAIDHH